MNRMIDADALLELYADRLEKLVGRYGVYSSECGVLAGAMKLLEIQPTIEPERKKGKWNFVGDQMFECTECGTCYTQNQFQQMKVLITDPDFPRFCPMCGADMRKGG